LNIHRIPVGNSATGFVKLCEAYSGKTKGWFFDFINGADSRPFEWVFSKNLAFGLIPAGLVCHFLTSYRVVSSWKNGRYCDLW